MNHVWTKALALICVALLVLSLAACGEKKENAGGSDNSSAVSSKEESAASSSTASSAANDDAGSSTAASSAQDAASSTAESKSDSAGDNALVGSWEYEGGMFIYTFNPDGTGNYDIGTDKMNFTYKADGSTISFLFDGNTEPMELKYELDGDTLNIKDSFDSATIYKRK